MAMKYPNWLKYFPNGQKIYQHLSLQDTPRFTKIGIFGLKIYHLATVVITIGFRTWTGLIGMVQRKEVDFSISAFSSEPTQVSQCLE
jgi:hypothetical protein